MLEKLTIHVDDFLFTLFLIWVVVGCLMLTGCANHKLDFAESITDLEGNVTTTQFKISTTATWGSNVDEGIGSIDYKGPDWHLKANQAASGLQAGDPSEMFTTIMGQMVPVFQMMAQPNPAAENIIQTMIQNPQFIEALADAIRPNIPSPNP